MVLYPTGKIIKNLTPQEKSNKNISDPNRKNREKTNYLNINQFIMTTRELKSILKLKSLTELHPNDFEALSTLIFYVDDIKRKAKSEGINI